MVISKSVGKEVKKTAQIMGSNITVTWTVVESYPVNADDDPGHSLLFVLFLPSYLLSSSLLSVLPSLPSPFPPLTCTSARTVIFDGYTGPFWPSYSPVLSELLYFC